MLLLALAFALPVAAATPEAAVVVKAAAGEGLKVIVGDDDFTFQVRGRVQLRAEGSATPDQESALGFQVRRLRLSMAGDVLQKRFAWNVQLGFAPRDLESDNPIIVRDANVSWNLSQPLRLRLGQMKVPFDRQRITSSASLAFPERSDVVNELTLDRDIGIVAFSAPLFDAFTYQVGIFGGDGRNRLNEDLGLLATARVQWMPLGAFDDDLIEGDLERDDNARLAIAAAVGFNAGSPRVRSTTGAFRPDERVDYAHATADVLFKTSGASVLVEGLARIATGSQAEQPVARSGLGVFGQVGLMVAENLEVVARAGHIEPLEVSIANEEGFVPTDELRAGLNIYVLGHDVKLSNDLGVTTERDAAPVINGHVMAQIAF